jgi:hypothetical protein
LWSILTVAWIIRVVANEGVGALVIYFEDQTLDATILFEYFSDVVFREIEREILRVDVVVDSAEITLVSWLVLDGLVRIGFRICSKGS